MLFESENKDHKVTFRDRMVELQAEGIKAIIFVTF